MNLPLAVILAGLVVLAETDGANIDYVVSKLASQLRSNQVTRLNLGNINSITGSDCLVLDAYGDSRRAGGVLISSATNTNFLQCLLMCVTDNKCKDLNWNRNNTCSTFSDLSISQIPDTNYIYARQACNPSGSAALPPDVTPMMTLPSTSGVTTRTPGTPRNMGNSMMTAPSSGNSPTLTSAAVPDICRVGYQTISGEYQAHGQVIHVRTLDQCIRSCLADNTCLGVDFNHDTSPNFNCFKHTTIISTDIVADDCCTRVVKVSCLPRQCFSHAVIDLAALIENDDISMIQDSLTLTANGSVQATSSDCSGACVTVMVTNSTALPPQPSSIERLCDTTLAPSVEKRCDVIDDAGIVTTTCRCYGNLCNAFGADLLSSCLVYYPFDGNANDVTAGRRHGYDVNVTYDAVDAKKNVSARFTGKSSIKVMSLRNTVYSYKTPSGGQTPALTITIWIKRTGMAGRQAVVNNGPVGGATIDISTEPNEKNATFYLVKGTVKINDVTYTVQSPRDKLEYGKWHFIVLLVTSKPFLMNASAFFYVQMLVDDIPSPGDAVSYAVTDVMMNATTVGVQTSTFPLSIGTQPSPVPEAGHILAGPDMYTLEGSVDELYIFSRELSMAEIESVKWISSTKGPFLA